MRVVAMAQPEACPAPICTTCPHTSPRAPPVPQAPRAPSPPRTTQNSKNRERPPNGTSGWNPRRLSEAPPRPLLPRMAWLRGRRPPAATATVCQQRATGRRRRGCCPRAKPPSRARKTRGRRPPRGAGSRCWLRGWDRVVALTLKLLLTGTTFFLLRSALHSRTQKCYVAFVVVVRGGDLFQLVTFKVCDWKSLHL